MGTALPFDVSAQPHHGRCTMKQYTLPNGVQVVLHPWATPSATVAIGLRGSGSRNDPRSSSGLVMQGLNHFAEHVFFRASRRYPSWRELSRTLDRRASNYNAFTDQSSVVFGIETYSRRIEALIGILADMVRHPLLSVENIEFERERIRQEIRVYDDAPEERVDLELARRMLPRTGLDHPILGTELTLAKIPAAAIRHYHRRQVVGRRLVIAITGGFNLQRVEAAILRHFGRIRTGTTPPHHNLVYHHFPGNIIMSRDETKQFHVMIGWPTPGINDPRRIDVGVIRNLLTGRSSAMFKQELDAVGHGYSSEDFYWCYEDLGQYAIYLPMSYDHIYEAMQIIATGLSSLKQTLITHDDHELALENMGIDARGKASEPWDLAIFIARSLINAGSFKPLREYLRDLRSVSRTDIREAANMVFDPQRMTVIIRGPVQRLRRQRLIDLLRY